MSSSPCVVHRDALKSITIILFSPFFFLNFNEFKNHKKRLDFPFVCTRLQSDARVKRTRLNVCTTTTSSTTSSSKGPRRSLVAHENRRGFSPRAVARVFSSSSSIGCFCVLFVQTFARKGTRLLSCAVPEGPALGAKRTKSRYPALCAFPVLRFRSARRRERAHRLERDRA